MINIFAQIPCGGGALIPESPHEHSICFSVFYVKIKTQTETNSIIMSLLFVILINSTKKKLFNISFVATRILATSFKL